MDQSRATTLLEEAYSEIKRLRDDNRILRARMDVFDSMVLIVKGKSQGGGLTAGEAPDILWEINKFIKSNEVTSRLKGDKQHPTKGEAVSDGPGN